MSIPVPKLLFGAYGIASWSEDTTKEMLDVLREYRVTDIDTAYNYVNSEKTIRFYDIPSHFKVHTKAPGFCSGALKRQNILNAMEESLSRLGVSHVVETYFLHSPDESTPLEETLSAINQLHSEGKFTHFGLSNFPPAMVQDIYTIQSVNNAILPTIYQGNYNAFARHIENTLFPLLQKLKIAFYAYSPIAGGFLVKTPSGILNGTIEEGRFSGASKTEPIGEMYNSMYSKPSLLDGLQVWGNIAAHEGTSKAALSYRWIAWHSALKGPNDGVIIGPRKPSQLRQSLQSIHMGPLSDDCVKKIDEVWRCIEKEAPLDTYQSTKDAGLL